MKQLIRMCTTAFVLTVLLLAPALPAAADGGPAPGLFGWVQGWINSAMSWVTGEAGPTIDPNGLKQDSSGDAGPKIDPYGLRQGEAGPKIDPNGVTAEAGPTIDPVG